MVSQLSWQQQNVSLLIFLFTFFLFKVALRRREDESLQKKFLWRCPDLWCCEFYCNLFVVCYHRDIYSNTWQILWGKIFSIPKIIKKNFLKEEKKKLIKLCKFVLQLVPLCYTSFPFPLLDEKLCNRFFFCRLIKTSIIIQEKGRDLCWHKFSCQIFVQRLLFVK